MIKTNRRVTFVGLLWGGLSLLSINSAGALSLSDLEGIRNELGNYGLTVTDVAPVMAGVEYLTFDTAGQVIIVDDEASAKSLVRNVRDFGLDNISSTLSGNTIIVGESTFGVCSGSGTSYDILTVKQGYDCLGLGEVLESFQAANAVNEIQNTAFYINRPTTVIANTLSKIRLSRVTEREKEGAAGDYLEITDDMGVYFGAGGSFADVNTRDSFAGYGLFSREVTLGLDYRMADWVSSGFIYNYMSNQGDISVGGGDFYSDIFRFAPFVSFHPSEQSFIDFVLGYGLHDSRSSRSCFSCASRLHSEYTTDEYFGSLNLGYSYHIDALTLTGYVGASAMLLNIGPYTETGNAPSGNGLKVDRSYNLSVTNSVGVEATYAFSTPYGVLVPRLFGEWVHENENDVRVVKVNFQGTDVPSVFSTPEPERNWGHVGFGAQMVLPDAVSIFANYQSLIIRGATNHTVEGGIRVEF